MTGSSGGAGDLKVGAGVLQSAAKEITSAQDDLTGYAAHLERQLAPMAAKWRGAGASAFFEFFNARPALGRFFTGDEDVTPRGGDVAVLSYALWQSEFGGRDVRGEVLRVGDIRTTIPRPAACCAPIPGW